MDLIQPDIGLLFLIAVLIFFLALMILFNFFWIRIGSYLEDSGQELKNIKLLNAGKTMIYAWKLRQKLMYIFFAFFIVMGAILKIMYFSGANTILIIGVIGELVVFINSIALSVYKKKIRDESMNEKQQEWTLKK